MDKHHAGYDTPEMDFNEKAYALKIEVTGYVVETKEPLGVIEKLKTICTPAGAISTRSGGLTCEGHRGRVTVSSSLMDHITTCEAGTTSSERGGASSKNGKCNPENNNAAQCWDGGDCCKPTCLFRWGNMFDLDGKLYNWECDELTDDLCLDTTVQVYPTSYDFQTSEQILGEPTSFSGLGADDYGESICGDVVDYFNKSLWHGATTDKCRTLGEESDECTAELKTMLCNDATFPTGLAECVSALVNATFLTKDNKPRCPTVVADLKTTSGCTCQVTWSYVHNSVTHSYTNGYCGSPDGDSKWCKVVDGSCSTTNVGDVGRAATDDGTSGYYWDYCTSDQPSGVYVAPVWTDSMVLELFPEVNNPDRGISPAVAGATEMTILEVNTNTCSSTQYLNENTGACVSMCSDGQAMVGGECKAVCGSRRR